MPRNPLSDEKTTPVRKAPDGRKTGTLNLFLPVAEPARPNLPYARFRFRRGFIDDLNLILPLRVRIRLEAEVSKGMTRGEVEGPALRFRWEFLEH